MIFRPYRVAAFATAILISVLLPGKADAFKLVIDGIEYNCNKTNGRASVQGCEDKAELTKLNIPDNILHSSGTYTVTSIASKAFEGCTELTKVTMGNYIETIGSYAFSETSIRTITLSQSLRIIGQSAFYHSDIRTLELPESLEIIRANAFMCNHYLTSVTFGRKIQEIGKQAFYWCDRLEAAMLPNTVASLGEEAFLDCDKLSKVNIPTSLTTIPVSAFENCPITNLVIPSNITSIGNAAFCCNRTPSISIPGSVKSIGEWAFALGSCTQLSLGEGITTIRKGAFNECTALTEVTIPTTVTSIGERAFYNSYAIKTVYSPRAVPPTCGDEAFDPYTYEHASLEVSTPSAELYRNAPEWTKFKSLWQGITSVTDITADPADGNESQTEYFDLCGRRISRPAPGSICLRRRLNETGCEKVVVR